MAEIIDFACYAARELAYVQYSVSERREIIARHMAALVADRDDSIRELERRSFEAMGIIRTIRTKLESIVCTEPPDAGVVLLSYDGQTHTELDGAHHCQVYDHEHFSPLGDALIELWRMTDVADG